MILWPSLFWSHKPVSTHLDQTLEFFQLWGFVIPLYSKPKTRRWKTSKFEQTALEKTQRFSSPSFPFWVWCKMENSEFDQSTSEFDQNASEKISEVYISEFPVLGIEWKNLGKIFSEISENSEFSTSACTYWISNVWLWCTPGVHSLKIKRGFTVSLANAGENHTKNTK